MPIKAIRPRPSDDHVHPKAAYTFEITDQPTGSVTLANIRLYLSITPPESPDPVYPANPNYYGTSIDRTIYNHADTNEVTIYDNTGWQANFNTSTITQVNTYTVRMIVKPTNPLPYSHWVSWRVQNTGVGDQRETFQIQPREFFSPAIGDSLSTFETYVKDTDIAAKLPETKTLRDLCLTKFDTRAPHLAIRRMSRLFLEPAIGFTDWQTIPQRIKAGAQTLLHRPVAKPQGLKAIDQAMGSVGLEQVRKSLKELEEAKSIPRLWVEPVVRTLDFINVDLTHRVKAYAQAVAVGFRAVKDGYL